jgi:hypothetical protein
MGSQKDVMAIFAERDIRQAFSENDGWKITQLNISPSDGSLYRISRYKWGGGDDVAFVKVSFDPAPDAEAIKALEALPEGKRSRTAKYLLTPRATNTADIPANIRILPMTAFTFDGETLVWLTKKKNARKIFLKTAAAA